MARTQAKIDYGKSYYEANREVILERSRKRHSEKREEILEQMRERYKKPVDFRVIMLDRARQRAKSKNLDFSITVKDFEIPDRCPVFGNLLERNFEGKAGPFSPSLDRIDSSLGYIPGNVQVISYQANIMKSNATVDELIQFADWIRKEYM